MSESLVDRYGRPPTRSEISALRPMERCIVMHSGRERVAKVVSHYDLRGVRSIIVWLKKSGAPGFCHTKTTIRTRDIVDITYCRHLSIDAAAGQLASLGGAS